LGATVPAQLELAWQISLDASMTQPVVIDDTLYVASRDTHTFHAVGAA
jgi:hypothetical protein